MEVLVDVPASQDDTVGTIVLVPYVSWSYGEVLGVAIAPVDMGFDAFDNPWFFLTRDGQFFDYDVTPHLLRTYRGSYGVPDQLIWGKTTRDDDRDRALIRGAECPYPEYREMAQRALDSALKIESKQGGAW